MWLPLLLIGCLDVWVSGGDLNLRDLDGDGVIAELDCDDADPQVGRDAYWADEDGDGYGDPDGGLGCARPEGAYAENQGDCDDAHNDLNPESLWYADGDGDGWLAEGAATVQQCEDPDGGDLSALPQYWLPRNTTGLFELDALGDGDCDDADPALNPMTEWTPDADGDGFGDMSPSADEVLTQCAQPLGHARLDLADDCDDADELTNPDTIWYRDDDQDGYGVSGDFAQACAPPEGYTAPFEGDCDDSTPYFARLCPYTFVEAGYDEACAMRSDGQVECWDGTAFGEDVAPPGVSYSEVSAYQESICGLSPGGAVDCWAGAITEADAPEGEGFYGLSANSMHACALRDGAVSCWGSTVGSYGYALPAGDDFQLVVADFDGACAIRGSDGVGSLMCWGGLAFRLQEGIPEGADFVGLATSLNMTACALRESGTLACWGNDLYNKISDAPSDDDIVSVGLGAPHGCALHEDGRVSCWGHPDSYLDVPEVDGEPLRLSQLSVGLLGNCGVDLQGRLQCWGEIPSPPGSRFERLALGPDYGCGAYRTALGCWGAKETALAYHGPFTELEMSAALCAFTAAGEVVCQDIRTDEGPDVPIVDEGGAAIHYQHLEFGEVLRCGLTTAGEVRCFGGLPPSTLPEGQGWTRLSLYDEGYFVESGDENLLCAVHADGRLSCHGALTDAVPSDTDFVDVAVMRSAVCALHADGRVSCFNASGDQAVIADAPAGDGFVKLAKAGEYHNGSFAVNGACALHADGSLSCWGEDAVVPPSGLDFVDFDYASGAACGLDAAGALSCFGDQAPSDAPTDARFVRISGDKGRWCGLTEGGRLLCWGAPLERALLDPFELTQLSAGARGTCAVIDGAVYCEGDGPLGEDTPSLYGDYQALALGDFHGCALDAAGALRCWGDDTLGQLSAPSGAGFQRLAAGGDSACAVDAAGGVRCWGLVPWSQRGEFVALAVGMEHACALSVDGSVTCTGDDSYGQASPPEDTRFVDIAAGDWHTCGLVDAGDETSQGLPLCWGLDIDRQVRGAPTATLTALYAAGDQTCGLGLDGLPLCWGRRLLGDCPDPPLPTALGTCEP